MLPAFIDPSIIPHKPGVYRYKDSGGKIIYVGKAIDLHNRVSSYFNGQAKDTKTYHLVQNIASVETTVVESEIEALILEANLIKQYLPLYNIKLRKNVYVMGNVIFGENIIIGENVHLSCFPNQKLEIKNNVEILWGDIIKGNISIGENTRIESSVNITGSDEYPTRIGKNITIKGTSYVFGSIIDDDLFIEHSVLIKKKVDKLIRKDGKIQDIRFFLPMPEGIDTIEDI